MGYLIVFLGAGMGGALRHGINLASARLFGTGLPVGTFIVNVLGSFLIGLLAGYFLVRSGVGQHARLFLVTGVLGGFTTFSTYAVDIQKLVDETRFWTALLYLFATLVAALAAVWLAVTAARRVLKWRRR